MLYSRPHPHATEGRVAVLGDSGLTVALSPPGKPSAFLVAWEDESEFVWMTMSMFTRLTGISPMDVFDAIRNPNIDPDRVEDEVPSETR